MNARRVRTDFFSTSSLLPMHTFFFHHFLFCHSHHSIPFRAFDCLKSQDAAFSLFHCFTRILRHGLLFNNGARTRESKQTEQIWATRKTRTIAQARDSQRKARYISEIGWRAKWIAHRLHHLSLSLACDLMTSDACFWRLWTLPVWASTPVHITDHA